MSASLQVPLRRLGDTGRDDLWSLELAPGQATLRDGSGVLRNAFTPEEAAREWALPSFVHATALTLPADEGPISFQCGRRGLGCIRAYMRSGLAAAGPRAVRGAWLRALGEVGLGLLLLVGGVAGSLASYARSARTGGTTVYWGLVLVGLLLGGRGLYRTWQCLLLPRDGRRDMAPPRSFVAPGHRPLRVPQVGAPAETVIPAPRRGMHPVERGVWITLGVLVVAMSSAVIAGLLRGLPAGLAASGPAKSGTAGAPSPAPGALSLEPASEAPGPAAWGVGPTEVEGDATALGPAVDPKVPPDSQLGGDSPDQFLGVTLLGAVEAIEPPLSVEPGRLVSNEKVRLFIECVDRVLEAGVVCDATEPGPARPGSPGVGGTLEPGKRVCAYLLHANIGAGRTARMEGEVTFPSEILGVVWDRGHLDASDAPLGHPTTVYPTGGQWRGWFDGDSEDWVAISDDRRTLSFRGQTARWLDQLRVVTAPRGEP